MTDGGNPLGVGGPVPRTGSGGPEGMEGGDHSASAFDAILKRRISCRAYRDQPVDRMTIATIIEAARWAPSACNSQTWRFVAVTDPATITRIAAEAMRPVIPNRWLAQAPLIIVGCSRLDIVANRLGSRVTGVDYYQIDLGIAMEHVVLKATELGLGTCWIGWFKEAVVKQLLGIPRAIKVSALLAVGHPVPAAVPNRRRKALSEILFYNRWKQ
jgi:nitroreductase